MLNITTNFVKQAREVAGNVGVDCTAALSLNAEQMIDTKLVTLS